MSDHLLFSPNLDPTERAKVKNFTILNQPQNTTFDSYLGALYGDTTTTFSGVPSIVLHYYDDTTRSIAVPYPTPSVSGNKDAGSDIISAALTNYTTYSISTDPTIQNNTLALANFVVVVKTLLQYPSDYNLNFVISYMQKYATTAFAWTTFFAMYGSDRSHDANRAAAFYTACYKLLNNQTTLNVMHQIMLFPDMNLISGWLFKKYSALGIHV